MQVDHLIIGQGISGTLLSRSLMNAGRSVMVIDNNNASSASRVASGIINPVTGKRHVRTWMIEELMPFARNVYKAMEAELCVPIIRQCSILGMHNSHESRYAFQEKLPAEKDYLREGDAAKYAEWFRFNYGVGEISPCYLVDIKNMLSAWRQHLQTSGSLLEEDFNFEGLKVQAESVSYNHITARNIIFCDGATCAENPYFSRLPWSKDKGEALLISIPGLPPDNIYRQGINMVPWQDEIFWVGATHDWKFTDMLPSSSYREQVEKQVNYWLKLPYTILDHKAAQRPVNVERKPFVGFHPVHKAIGIFNGMGTKGCSVAPYFAYQLAQNMINNTPIMPDVDIARFTKTLSR